jgi:hypothetical protein
VGASRSSADARASRLPYEPKRTRAPAGYTDAGKPLEARGKPRLIVVVVIARELAGHCWALATID